MFGHPFRADSPAGFVGPRPSHTTRIQPAWVRPARSQPSNPRDPTAPNSSPNATHLSWYSTPIHSHPHQPQPSASTANPSHRQPHSHHDPPAAQHRAAPAFVPDTQPTFEETTTISFTWTIRDLHLLREEVEHSPPPSEGGRSVSAGAGKSDIWTNPPVFGDGKWKLELVRTTRSLASPSHEPPRTPHHTRPSASVDSTDATSSPTTASASITILSVYLTALVLDYTHANVEIPACIMLGLRPVRAPVGRRGETAAGCGMLQDDPVARQDAIALTIQLGLGPGHVRELEGLLGHGAVARVPVEVEGHHLVPRAMLTSLHGLLDDANTGDVRIIVRERGVRLPQPDKDAATSDDEETSSVRSARIVPFPIGSAHPAQAQGEAEGEEQMYVRDRVLWAHASVLRSRSDYFGTMLGSEFSEGIGHVYGSGARRVRTLRIPDADFATAYWFLRYLYTDEVEFAPNEDVRSAVLDDEWAKPGQHAEGAQGAGEGGCSGGLDARVAARRRSVWDGGGAWTGSVWLFCAFGGHVRVGSTSHPLSSHLTRGRGGGMGCASASVLCTGGSVGTGGVQAGASVRVALALASSSGAFGRHAHPTLGVSNPAGDEHVRRAACAHQGLRLHALAPRRRHTRVPDVLRRVGGARGLLELLGFRDEVVVESGEESDEAVGLGVVVVRGVEVVLLALLVHLPEGGEHLFAHRLGQLARILRGEVRGGDGRQHLDADGAALEARLGVKDPVVVLAHHRHDGNTRLDRQMEGTLFERKQVRGSEAGSRAFGENPETELVLVHGVAHLLERLDAVLEILAVDKHGAGQRHELAQERRELQLLLGHNRRMPREDAAEIEDVHGSLVVAHHNGGSGLIEMLLALDDEPDTDKGANQTPEGPRDDAVDVEPLSRDERHDDRDDDAPKAADAQAGDVDERVEVEAHALAAGRGECDEHQCAGGKRAERLGEDRHGGSDDGGDERKDEVAGCKQDAGGFCARRHSDGSQNEHFPPVALESRGSPGPDALRVSHGRMGEPPPTRASDAQLGANPFFNALDCIQYRSDISKANLCSHCATCRTCKGGLPKLALIPCEPNNRPSRIVPIVPAPATLLCAVRAGRMVAAGCKIPEATAPSLPSGSQRQCGVEMHTGVLGVRAKHSLGPADVTIELRNRRPACTCLQCRGVVLGRSRVEMSPVEL
ncbi:hypothetical protein L1887_45980 [Cichorium endivia]|nr:hypothetical protein L1887_45980 [Cichorium endivia]